MKKIRLKILCATVFSALVVAGCDKIIEFDRKAVRENNLRKAELAAREKGQAALADCIEVKCERLDLDGFILDDFTVLNEMTHVKALMVSRSNFDDLEDIRDMSQLRELHISNTNVSDVSGLVQFPDLELLHAAYLARGASIDVDVVAGLKKLEELALWRLDDIEEASVIHALPNLKRLVIDWKGEPETMDVFAGHRTLEKLDVRSHSLSIDQKGLLAIPNLKSFSYLGWGEVELDPEIKQQLELQGTVSTEVEIAMC